MRTGVQTNRKLNTKAILEGGFSYVELPYCMVSETCEGEVYKGKVREEETCRDEIYIDNVCKNKICEEISGLTVPLAKLTPKLLCEALAACKACGGSYIALETMNCRAGILEPIVKECATTLKEYGIPVFLENGCDGNDATGYVHGPYSDAEDLRRIVLECNNICRDAAATHKNNTEITTETNAKTATEAGIDIITETDEKNITGTNIDANTKGNAGNIGICYNIGYANLLAQNIRVQLEQCGDDLQLVHVNDNGGFKNDKQMPYTFTKGRGELTTDWYHIIATLIRMKYDGWLIFDVEGLFERCPVGLQTQFMQLLHSLQTEWENQFSFAKRVLHQPDKKLILFGAGQMLTDYMRVFGKEYPPSFAVDNNQSRWETSLCGVLIKNPTEILKIPKEERNVVICCMFYDAIGVQLRQMGVEYEEFHDRYFV